MGRPMCTCTADTKCPADLAWEREHAKRRQGKKPGDDGYVRFHCVAHPRYMRGCQACRAQQRVYRERHTSRVETATIEAETTTTEGDGA
jgi:hypothetical protein